MTFLNITTLFVYGLIALLSLPIIILFVQTLCAALARKKKQVLVFDSANVEPSVGVIVPAHNEAGGIQQTLDSVMPQLKVNDQLIVVADNCTDNTAEVVRAAGATVVERYDETFKGKGYALDFGLQELTQNPPDVVLIVDADCIIAPNLIEVASKSCIQLNRPIQVDYLMEFPSERSLKQKVIEFAWVVKNKVRPAGYKLLGLPCQLMGTGMAFLWTDLKACNLASGHLVEDMQLGLDLTKMRKPPYYLDATSVKSYFPTSDEGMSTQRNRWEHGHLSIIVQSPKLLIEAIMHKNSMMFMQVLDLIVPPLALLFMITATVMLLSTLLYGLFELHLALIFSSILMLILGFTIFIAWLAYGRKVISFKDLLLAPFVLLAKLPIYLGFAFNRQVDWVRSKRD